MEFGSPEAAGMQAYAEELRSMFMRMQDEALDLHKKARAVQVTETSRDGLVSATVGPRGDLVRLDIDPRVYRRPDSRHLADTITETVGRAAAKARERVVEIFEPVIPPEQMAAHIDGDIETVMRQLAERMTGER
ncbi:YbaB/EbfC family nucleoid-associated protein [Nonomuraea muscovyensis]|uniref:DNA-binding protein YbaB n=1 Tax=Nonomuraea muscovyensis TaxID=1124761 RepID=A0A7X0EZA7_9ACTN|nr:YbaB/EbfC family nucleoid-associated protein [Nonomuraea muscovyensis]MBB6349608.1 DNA-binding protein YbaB [Nonomuraea muscovyensis]